MKVNITDGGRSQYFKGIAGDCVTRAVALVTGRDYKEVYDEIKKLIKRSPRDGVAKQATRVVMSHFGGEWVSCMSIGTGCKVHLKDGEIPMDKRIICSLSGHVAAVINGVINDDHDPSRNGSRCVYGYWKFN